MKAANHPEPRNAYVSLLYVLVTPFAIAPYIESIINFHKRAPHLPLGSGFYPREFKEAVASGMSSIVKFKIDFFLAIAN